MTDRGDDLSSKWSEKKTEPKAEQKTKKAYEEPKLAEEEPMSEEEYHYSLTADGEKYYKSLHPCSMDGWILRNIKNS